MAIRTVQIKGGLKSVINFTENVEKQINDVYLKKKNVRVMKSNSKLHNGKYVKIELPDLEQMEIAKSTSIPELCGIYFLLNNAELVYIGQSKNIAKRIKTHFIDKTFNTVLFLNIDQEWERLILEKLYIELFSPKHNCIPWSGKEKTMIRKLIDQAESKKDWDEIQRIV